MSYAGPAWNRGLTKETSEKVRKISEKNSIKRSDIFYQVDDDGKLFRRWSNKKVNAKKEGIGFNLTVDEYAQLVFDAGLVSSQLGFAGSGEKYVLARYNDSGDYCVGNCRFITQLENYHEQYAYQQRQKEITLRIKSNEVTTKYDWCACGNKKTVGARMCLGCYEKNRPHKIDWPPYDELIQMVTEHNFLWASRQLGVSDNAIRKHLQTHDPCRKNKAS